MFILCGQNPTYYAHHYRELIDLANMFEKVLSQADRRDMRDLFTGIGSFLLSHGHTSDSNSFIFDPNKPVS